MVSRGEFPTTHWSVVIDAGSTTQEAKTRALARVVENYMSPLRYHLVYAKKLEASDADDILQSFVADQILEGNLLRSADQQRGRFRAFIVTALNNFLLNQRRDNRAQKRSPASTASLDEALFIPEHGASPSANFDLMWAKEVIAQTIQVMKANCAISRPELWEIFESRILFPALNGDTPPPYSQMVAKYGFVSPTQAANAVVTANRMFARTLRLVISRYEKDPDDIEEELRDLMAAISSMAGRSRLPSIR